MLAQNEKKGTLRVEMVKELEGSLEQSVLEILKRHCDYGKLPQASRINYPCQYILHALSFNAE